MEFLFNYTPLNKDICNITFQYINYSVQNLNKIIRANKNNEYNERLQFTYGRTLIDVMVLCVSFGYNGFYMDKHQIKMISFLDKHMKECNAVNGNIISRKDNMTDIIYYISYSYNKTYVNLCSLGVVELVKIK
jgi:hypothetical protein